MNADKLRLAHFVGNLLGSTMSPFKPSAPCHYPGCPNLSTYRGYCDKHRQINDRERGNNKDRGYGDIWPEIRVHKLNINPLCERCLKQGLTVIATQVHHKDGDVWNRSEENLESLCAPCHSKETDFGRGKIY